MNIRSCLFFAFIKKIEDETNHKPITLADPIGEDSEKNRNNYK